MMVIRKQSSLTILNYASAVKNSLVMVRTIYYLDDSELALALPSGVLEALQLQTCDANDVVARLEESLSLVQASLEQPGPKTKRQVRCLCKTAKNANRLDVVKKLREIAPAGTTGEGFLYIHLICNQASVITWSCLR